MCHPCYRTNGNIRSFVWVFSSANEAEFTLSVTTLCFFSSFSSQTEAGIVILLYICSAVNKALYTEEKASSTTHFCILQFTHDCLLSFLLNMQVALRTHTTSSPALSPLGHQCTMHHAVHQCRVGKSLTHEPS